MYEHSIVIGSFLNLMENLPSKSVVVPMFCSMITTFAPMRGSFDLKSVIIPSILFWDILINPKHNKIKINCLYFKYLIFKVN